MNLGLTSEQEMLCESFARFLDHASSSAKLRLAMAGGGFDRALWEGLAGLGAFAMRVPEAAGGLGLGLFDATLLMEEVGRTLAAGPIAEALVAARLLGLAGNANQCALLNKVMAGERVVAFAFHDIAVQPRQFLAGGAYADAVIACRAGEIVLVKLEGKSGRGEPDLASTGIAEIDLGALPATALEFAGDADKIFAAAVEEWKLLVAAALSGLARQALKLAAAYAGERKQFGVFIGTFQAISHPLADLLAEVDGGKYLIWKTIHAIASGTPDAGAGISQSLWWNAETSARAVSQALHTFGGYGLTTEYDIHLYNLRAKAWPLVMGDPRLLLREAGRRLYANEAVVLPDVGAISIDFDLGEEAHTLAAELDEFFTKNLTPELRAKAHYSWDGHDPGIHKKLAEARLLYPSWPVEAGGRNAAPYAMNALSQVWEKHGWGSHASGTTGMVGAIIRRFGSDELKRDVLAKIEAGEIICSLGYSEPASGSDVFAAQCRATPEGNGWRIDGTKMFTSGANISDYVLMLTRTNPDVPKHKGLTMFIVPLKAGGVSVQAVHTFQDERTNITFYDGVRVPDSYRLGEVDGGVKTMSAGLEIEHGGGFGKTQQAMLHAAEKLCREIERDGCPLIEDDDARMRLARTATHVALSDVIANRALWAAAEKRPNAGFGPMAKLFSSEKLLADARDLLDLTAPLSLTKRTGPAGFLNQCYRHAHGTTIYGGTSEVHRSMIAERALGLPRTR
jgi:3-oxochol-4-en-24-oyl-CoA dehydrogenase